MLNNNKVPNELPAPFCIGGLENAIDLLSAIGYWHHFAIRLSNQQQQLHLRPECGYLAVAERALQQLQPPYQACLRLLQQNPKPLQSQLPWLWRKWFTHVDLLSGKKTFRLYCILISCDLAETMRRGEFSFQVL